MLFPSHRITSVAAVAAGGGGGGHRYWRIYVTANAVGNSINIAEMELRSTASGADQTGSGTASSGQGNLTGTPADAFDNNAGTTWHSAIGTLPHWLIYDFGVGVTNAIVEVSIQAHPSNPAYSPIDFAIEYSDDNSSWTQEWAVTGSSGWTAGEIRVFTKPSAGAPLDGVTGVTGAYSFSRDLLSTFSSARYTDTGGAIDTLVDQSGNSSTFSGTTTARPTVATAGPNSETCGDFDGTNDWLTSSAILSAFMSATAGYMIVSFIADTVGANDSQPANNAPVVGDQGGYMGIYLKGTSGTRAVQCYNFASGFNTAESTVITLGTAYVVEWWHAGNVVYGCVNNGTPFSISSLNTGVITNPMGLGHAFTSSGVFFDGKIFELAICNAVPATRSTIAADFMTHIGAV